MLISFLSGAELGCTVMRLLMSLCPVTTVCTALGLLFGVGGASNFNLKLGAGKREEAAKYIGNAITLLVGSGVVLAVFVLVFLKPLMIAFGATDIVLKYGAYFGGNQLSGFPVFVLGTGGSTLVRADRAVLSIQ